MRDERLSPLPERDKRRTLEYWQNQPFGSVTVKSRRDDSTCATVNSARSDVAPSEGGSIFPLDSHLCGPGGTNAPMVTDNPTQAKPTPPRNGNVPVARKAQLPTTPNQARPRENTSAPQPSVPVERSNNNGTGPSSSTDEEVPRTAPLEEEPLCNDEGRTCLLTSSHYIVSRSVGPSPSAMRPFHMAFDTGSGYNVVRLRDLPQGWENYRIPDASVPALGDANGKRLRLLGQVVLRVRFGSAMYRVSFLVAERLAVSAIIGTAFMNCHVRGIMCMDGNIKLTRATISIVSRHHGRKPYVEAKSPSTETPDGPPLHQGADNVNRPHTVKLAKFVTIPPLSQVAVPVRTEASGLVFLEAKHSVFARHNVLELKKCEFFQPKVDYLGHVITPGKLAVETENTKAFEYAVFRRNATQVRSFLGAANVYRRFVKNFSGIAKPLNEMLKKDANPTWDDPKPAAVEAFETLRRKLISPPVLALPKRGRPYMIDTDAYAYQLGATLLQQQDPSNPKEWVPVGYWSKTLYSAEQNYSATERGCYSVVWAINKLRPYIEGQKFIVRTDHDALRWLLTLSDTSGRLMRWRLRLSEFYFEIQYRSGRVHQVPDALLRLTRPGSDPKPVDDEIPTFGDHKILVTTRANTRRSAANGAAALTEEPSTGKPDPVNVPTYWHNDDEVMDEVLDDALDVFDIGIADQAYEPVEATPAGVPTKITIEEILEAPKTDSFCQNVLARQSKRIDSAFFDGPDGLLRRRHPREPDIEQVLLPDTLHRRVLQQAHHAKLAGHPCQTRMYYNVLRTYYWPHMAAGIFATVRNCTTCAKNRLKLRKRTNPLKLSGNEAASLLVYRYTWTAYEIETRIRIPTRDHRPIHETYAFRTVA